MDLIHANSLLAELGFISEIDSFDAELSQDSAGIIEMNSFSLTIPDTEWESSPIEIEHYIYIQNSEWGGKVEKISHSTAFRQVTVSGLTWRGMMFRKIIIPPGGSAYREIIGAEANAAMRTIAGTQLGPMFDISTDNSGITISNSKFRYTNMLIGIEQMLEDNGAALDIKYDQSTKTVKLKARPIVDYSNTIDLSQDYGADMITTIGGYDRFNHIIALGAGELVDRDVVHVYRLDSGTVTLTPPSWAGTSKDHARIYDYSSAETYEELVRGAQKMAREYSPYKMVEMDPSVQGLTLLLGDKVSARDRLTGLKAIVTITGQILTMNTSGVKLETRVG